MIWRVKYNRVNFCNICKAIKSNIRIQLFYIKGRSYCMSIKTAIVKPLEAGYVQVDATDKSGYTRNYKAPKKYAEKFASELKQQEKDIRICSDILLIGSIVARVAGTIPFTKKIDSRLNQILIQSAVAISLAVLSTIGMIKFAESEEKELMNKYGAKEIFYKA